VARAADLPTFTVLVQQHGTLFDAAARLPRLGELRGRGLAVVVEIGGTACVVRHYHRGGAVAGMLQDRYGRLGLNRALHELQVSESARARGVATPTVKCAAWYRHGLFRRFDLATTFIPSSRDLAAVLFGAGAAQERDVRAAVKLIRDVLRAGLVHNDLNLKNILVAEDRAYILDLDRCRIEEGVSAAASKVMRERFLRSLAKWERLTSRTVPADVRAQLAEAFGG
jgi:3-deoxy-D-manno-octulosonic acid kinase